MLYYEYKQKMLILLGLTIHLGTFPTRRFNRSLESSRQPVLALTYDRVSELICSNGMSTASYLGLPFSTDCQLKRECLIGAGKVIQIVLSAIWLWSLEIIYSSLVTREVWTSTLVRCVGSAYHVFQKDWDSQRIDTIVVLLRTLSIHIRHLPDQGHLLLLLR